MPRAFHSFVAQIKRNFRRAIASVSNEKEFLAQLRFKIVAHFFQRRGRAFPSAHPVARIAPRKLITCDAQQIRVQRDQAHD